MVLSLKARDLHGYWRSRYARAAIALSFMFDVLRRLLADTRPVDWIIIVIELLVLALIAYEVGYDVRHRVVVKRRVRTVLELLAAGINLREQAGSLAIGDIEQWKQSVTNWTNESHKVLTGCSPQAGLKFGFLQARNASSYLGIAKDIQGHYGTLSARLDTLREIAENPHGYF